MAALLLALCPLLSAGGQKSPPAQVAPLDPCALLTADDIKRVQGERLSSTRRSEQAADNFRLLQCLYATAAPTKSVSLAVAIPVSVSTSGVAGPRRFWNERFHADRRSEDGELKAGDDKGESGSPVPVAGVGDEAYWMGNRLVGALYVLSCDLFLRISVGGGESDNIKRRQSVALARVALARVQQHSVPGMNPKC